MYSLSVKIFRLDRHRRGLIPSLHSLVILWHSVLLLYTETFKISFNYFYVVFFEMKNSIKPAFAAKINPEGITAPMKSETLPSVT